jgi:hypothetical protein
MLLFPHAVQALRTSIASASRNVWSSCAPLWDCDAQRAIYGVKIYRLSIVKQFPYSNTPSCEIEQVARLRATGYEELLQPLDFANCLGEHGKHYSPETIFKRWQRCFQKHRLLGNMQWIEPYPRVLLDRYVKTGEIFQSLCLFRRHGENNRYSSSGGRARLERYKQGPRTLAKLFPG